MTIGLQEIITILTAIIGPAGLISGFLAWRKDKNQGPIDKNTADIANAAVISAAAAGLVQTMQDRMNAQEERLNELDKKVSNLSLVISNWRSWYQDLQVRWNYHKTKPTPPPAPTQGDNT